MKQHQNLSFFLKITPLKSHERERKKNMSQFLKILKTAITWKNIIKQ